jgi:hypothetical protein
MSKKPKRTTGGKAAAKRSTSGKASPRKTAKRKAARKARKPSVKARKTRSAKGATRKTSARKTTKKARKASSARSKTRRSAARGTTARWRSTDPDTSRLAAEKVSTSDLERIVVDDLEIAGRQGRTTDESTDSTGRSKVSVSPRFAPLCKKGIVFGSKERRRGHSGSMMTVWKLVKYRRFEPKEARA